MTEWIAKLLTACAGFSWILHTGCQSFVFFGEEAFPTEEEE